MDSKEIYTDLQTIGNNYSFYLDFINCYSLDLLFKEKSLKRSLNNCLKIAKKYNKPLEFNNKFIDQLIRLIDYLIKLYHLFLKDSN